MMAYGTRCLALAACAATSLVAGCVGFGTYPNAAGGLTSSGINTAAGEEIVVEAARWVLKYDYGSVEAAPPVVLNMPAGVTPKRAGRILTDLGPTVRAATPETLAENGPVYHIGRMALRGGEAEIDVYRPVFDRPSDAPALDPGTAPGEPVYQCITLTVMGGDEPWHVERSRPWALGAFTPPVITVVEPVWPTPSDRLNRPF